MGIRVAPLKAASARTVLYVLLTVMLTALALPGVAQAQRETIQADTSDRDIAIGSDFTGARITVFGAVDNSRQPAANSGYYDVIIVIRGPSETVIARAKERVAGIWVNGRSEAFEEVPSFYAALSTRPLDEIADDAALRRYGIEFNPKPQSGEASPAPDEFENAVIEAKKRERLYLIQPFSVAFLGTSLFRGTIALPTKVRNLQGRRLPVPCGQAAQPEQYRPVHPQSRHRA